MYQKKPRKVGRRIPEVLAALALLGQDTSWNVAKLLPGDDPTNVGKYLSRAVGLGLATVDRGCGPALFACVPGWHELVLARGGNLADSDQSVVKTKAAPASKTWEWKKPGRAVTPFAIVGGGSPVFTRAPAALPNPAELHPLYSVWR